MVVDDIRDHRASDGIRLATAPANHSTEIWFAGSAAVVAVAVAMYFE
jgi:hypothetical protein